MAGGGRENLDARLRDFARQDLEAQRALDSLQGQSARPLTPALSPRRGERGANGGWRKRKAHKREKDEHYVEEPWVSRRLLETSHFMYVGPYDGRPIVRRSVTIVDPCAGLGNVIRSARALGFGTIGSDKRKDAAPGYVRGGVDFLSADYELPCEPPCALVFNPPFRLMREFIDKAITLPVHAVAALVPVHRLAAMGWLQDEDYPLTETLFLSPRPSMWPAHEYQRRLAAGEKLGTGYQDFCWLILHPGASFCGFAGWLRRDEA